LQEKNIDNIRDALCVILEVFRKLWGFTDLYVAYLIKKNRATIPQTFAKIFNSKELFGSYEDVLVFTETFRPNIRNPHYDAYVSAALVTEKLVEMNPTLGDREKVQEVLPF
jgi:hypothetical protein